MSQLDTGRTGSHRGKPSHNIYTVLALVALIALVAGITFVWYRSGQLFGTTLPFDVLP